MFFLTLPIRLLLEVYRREKSVCFVEKYLILAPWAIQGIYSFIVKEESERDLTNFLILPFLLWRMLHNQIWISLSRYRNAKGGNLLVDKSLEFEQVDREQNCGIVYYLFSSMRISLLVTIHSRYHSHHHSSIVTEPMTSVTHLFAKHIAYFMLFTIPLATIIFTGTASLASVFGYVTYIDLMNNMGHCNFEFIPKWLFSIFPQLKYLMYTPS
ncbi:hypothetical protein CMV_021095 [Castanea mollissima]|uniref:Uncharacterized protein n=1 Tax=Castanea mollissima TaxID=60419 RepID=A0A8J4QWU7_9ROSI|nr:hypothetical protein CMV_021095 [Castanea mollissima]